MVLNVDTRVIAQAKVYDYYFSFPCSGRAGGERRLG